jgi:hypothetical protein
MAVDIEYEGRRPFTSSSFYERSRSELTSNEAGVEFSYKQCACDSYGALIANSLVLIARFLLTSHRFRRVL